VFLFLVAKAGRWGCTGDVRVLEGHAFIVEAAVSIGGRDIKPGINVYRFANRIPLLFEVRLPGI
jgi:DNA topoisomerase VI subunit B